MSIHRIRIIESGHMSTQQLFELGLSFGVCKRNRCWPSLETMNSFLRGGTDEGALGTDIEWEPCELTQDEYEHAVKGLMKGEPFKMDTDKRNWENWINKIQISTSPNKALHPTPSGVDEL